MFSDVKQALMKERERNNKVQCGYKIGKFGGFVFLNDAGKPYMPCGIYQTIQSIVKAYNREEEAAAKKDGRAPRLLPKISAHIFRHTFCTRLCENTDNIKMIQGVMGHKNSRTTLDVYAHVKADVTMESFKQMEGAFKLA